MTGIYSILNSVNGKRYVGQAVDIKKRIQGHFKRLRAGKHHCGHLQLSFQKYGAGAFTHSVLEDCQKENLTDREQYWMDYYRDRGLYNTAPAAGSNIGVKFSAEVKAKQSAKLTGRPVSEETRAQMSASRMGWKPSDETRAKMSAAKRNLSQVTKDKMSKSHKGVKLSEEHREGMRKAKVGKPHYGHVLTMEDCKKHTGYKASAETRAKVSASLKGNKRRLGIPITPEAKAKISAALKGRKRSPELVARTAATRWGNKQLKTMSDSSGQI
jgi:group I intron endonuclease